MFRRYEQIIIPDIQSDQNLTGDLTHSGKISNHPKLHYLGVFCSVSEINVKEDIDYLFSVSGPEIQRTLFEEIILDQISHIPGKKVVVLGKPNDKRTYDNIKNTEIYSHVNRQKQNELLNRAKFVICRSGYTTVMELVALKKSALMIPTPGQTEQEYLAHHYQSTGIFHIAMQDGLDLLSELNKIQHSVKPDMDHIPVNDTKAFRHLISS
jgi:predicted glycosyltransferase